MKTILIVTYETARLESVTESSAGSVVCSEGTHHQVKSSKNSLSPCLPHPVICNHLSNLSPDHGGISDGIAEAAQRGNEDHRRRTQLRCSRQGTRQRRP
jgi:hypothetical protein